MNEENGQLRQRLFTKGQKKPAKTTNAVARHLTADENLIELARYDWLQVMKEVWKEPVFKQRRAAIKQHEQLEKKAEQAARRAAEAAEKRAVAGRRRAAAARGRGRGKRGGGARANRRATAVEIEESVIPGPTRGPCEPRTQRRWPGDCGG
jgi:hypothetical protein